ncbi:transketolase family protein [Cereibacter sphaeroides]|uniref:transketolase family protein n=1 Tax=Cereibacter sphaeroides TaxID=1063 RepID=UPI000E5BBC21|nr:transketolase C-terminal domain-containing protein [Cereibacter sphaeroides]RHZ92887.1 transketolase family protein [Cereibacter sphaeroides]
MTTAALGNLTPALKAPDIAASSIDEGHRTVSMPFGRALIKLAETRPEIVGMSADLAKYTDIHVFAERFPDRFYQMGMSEQLMATAAGGLAKEGFIPFATTYATFASRRCYDFMSQAVAEQHASVKLIGGLPGLTTGYGPSHQATDDIAIFRAMPNLTIIDPCDACEIEQMVPAIADHPGPVYARILRGNVASVLDEYGYRFEIGKSALLRGGNDVLIVSTGFMTMRALDAARDLKADGIDVAVLHVPTIKPLDEMAILREVRRGGRLIVTAENHSIVGGLGDAVASLIGRSGLATELRQIALPDRFLDAGTLPVLQERYGITRSAMCESIRRWL